MSTNDAADPPVAVPGPASASTDDFVRFCCGDPDCPNDCERETPPGPASVAPAEPPRRRITVTHTRSLTFVQAEVDAVWNSGILPIPHVEHVRADDPDARAIALFEALDGSSLELFWDEANDDVGYEITEDDPDA